MSITVIDKYYVFAKDEGGRLVIRGDLKVDDDLEIACNLFVTGSIVSGSHIHAIGSIEAGEGIKANGNISAASNIKAGWSIEAGGRVSSGSEIKTEGGIIAGFSIRAKTISSDRIFAGLCSWRSPTPEEKQIRCEKLLSGTVEYGELVITKPEPPKFIEQDGYKYQLVEAL